MHARADARHAEEALRVAAREDVAEAVLVLKRRVHANWSTVDPASGRLRRGLGPLFARLRRGLGLLARRLLGRWRRRGRGSWRALEELKLQISSFW